MKVSNLLGRRIKEAPSDCVIESHALMIRGGYMKYMSNGIYTLFTPAKRIMKKIESIIRDEMDKAGGQEVMFPVAMPASIWKDSGRYYSIGSEMARFKDRSGNDMVLGMTHEEAAVHLAKDTALSYQDFPFMIYQIQTKFRDEPRARGGLIRVREFTMKDAYSFHTSQEDLDSYYDILFKAYENIFRRAGAKNYISVKSDSGMMGGNVSHEFMLLTPIGEDTLAICPDCGYSANMEAAEVIINDNVSSEIRNLEKIYTPNCKTIENLTSLLKIDDKLFCKAVVYQKNDNDDYVVVFIRGDLEVNETKLRNYLGEEIHPGTIEDGCNIVAGFIGPYGIDSKVKVVYDSSLRNISSLVCGANETDYHFCGLNIKRDIGDVEYTDVAKTFEGAVCPVCGNYHIQIRKGIEIGNIFKLGTKYTESMDMTYLDSNGESRHPIMGCYGIGVGRLCASICQESHDDYGPIWPISIAPWQVEICNLRNDNETVTAQCEKLYSELADMGIEVLYDDRDIRPGAMFADADLFGIPYRIIVSPKTVEKNVFEIASRDKSLKTEIPINECVSFITDKIRDDLKKYN